MAAKICSVCAGVFTLAMLPSCSFHLATMTPLALIKNVWRSLNLPRNGMDRSAP